MSIMAETSQDWWANPVIGPVIAGTVLATLGYIAAMLRRIFRIGQQTEDHVLPYFKAPPNGNPDNTVPSRLKRVEHSQDEVKSELSIERLKVSEALDAQAEKVRDELATTKREVAEYADNDQAEHEVISDRMTTLEGGQQKILGKLDKLGGGGA